MSQRTWGKLAGLFVVGIGLWVGLKFLIPIAMPFLLAAVLALAAEPLVRNLHKYFHVPRGFASGIGVATTLLLTVLILLSLCALLVRELGSLAGILPDLENATMEGLSSLELWLLRLAQRAPEGISPILVNGVEGMFSNGSAILDRLTSTVLNLASSILKGLPDSALGLGTWMLAAFMISARLPGIRQWMKDHLPTAWHEKYAPWLATLKKTLWGWITAQAKLVGATFCILTAGFFLLRIEHSILWAAAVCLVDILPVLGTGTVLIPWSLVCLLQGQSLRALGLLGIYAIVSILRSVLEPRLVGKQLGLDPLVTLLAIYAGYRLWGLPGMIFAPVLAVAVTQMLHTVEKPS